MGLHIALLRGINVNGKRMIPMAGLREMAKGLGYQGVESYIQTGNLLLESPLDQDEVRHQLEGAIRAAFGFDVTVAVRSPGDIDETLARCPYQPAEGEVVYVAFAVSPPTPERLKATADAMPDSGDRCTCTSQEVYILYREGVHASSLSNAFFERSLGIAMTSRNLRTVQKLRELIRQRTSA